METERPGGTSSVALGGDRDPTEALSPLSGLAHEEAAQERELLTWESGGAAAASV